MLAILLLGAASGFPNQITESALQAWLKDAGATNTTIGMHVLRGAAVPAQVPVGAVHRPLSAALPRAAPRLDAGDAARARGRASRCSRCRTRPLAGADRALSRSPSCFSRPPRTSPSMPTAPTSRTPSERGLAAAATNLGYRAAAVAGLGLRAHRRGSLRLARGVPRARAASCCCSARHCSLAAVATTATSPARCASRWWNR